MNRKHGVLSMGPPEALERYRQEIDAEMRAAFDGRDSPMYDMMRYHLGWIDEAGRASNGSSGKALRPTLCMLACEALGGGTRRALPAAVALELTHNFSLIHDDIQDRDRERRHRPTVWALWGEAQAINVGSAMRDVGSLELGRLADRGVAPAVQIRAQRLLDESCLQMLEGQFMDISFESRVDVGIDEYVEMIDRKTAALISCALGLGALIAGGSAADVAAFERFGREIGLAFQIKDDVLGIWGDEKLTGKPFASDIRRKKKSFPIVYALQDAERKGEMREIYSREVLSNRDVERVLDMLEQVQARSTAERAAREHCDAGLAVIETVAMEPRARRDLEELADFLVQREY